MGTTELVAANIRKLTGDTGEGIVRIAEALGGPLETNDMFMVDVFKLYFGERDITVSEVLKIARALGVDAAQLLAPEVPC